VQPLLTRPDMLVFKLAAVETMDPDKPKRHGTEPCPGPSA
jgi:hypothetical protein